MHKVIIAVITTVPLLLGMTGCDRQAGEQMERAAEDIGDTVQNAAQKAGNKLEQWTEQATSDERPQDKRPKQDTRPKPSSQRASE